jgi:hypothetical protein
MGNCSTCNIGVPRRLTNKAATRRHACLSHGIASANRGRLTLRRCDSAMLDCSAGRFFAHDRRDSGSEAQSCPSRAPLAFLFDPMMAVHSSNESWRILCGGATRCRRSRLSVPWPPGAFFVSLAIRPHQLPWLRESRTGSSHSIQHHDIVNTGATTQRVGLGLIQRRALIKPFANRRAPAWWLGHCPNCSFANVPA